MANLRGVPAYAERKVKRKSNKKALVLLFMFFIIILAVLFFQSSLSHIQTITVQGNKLTDTTSVLKAAGFMKDGFYFGIGEKAAEADIHKLQTVASVKVDKQFPGRVSITIRENYPIAYWVDAESRVFPVLNNGYVLPEETHGAVMEGAPLLTGWKDKSKLKPAAAGLAKLDRSFMGEISEIKYSPTNSYPKKVIIYTKQGNEVLVEYDMLQSRLPAYDQALQQLVDSNAPSRGTFDLLDDVAVFRSYAGEGTNNEKQTEDESKNQ